MLRFPVKNQGLDPANKFGTVPQYSYIILCYLKCFGCSQDIDKGLLGLPGAGSVGTAHPDEIPLVQTKDDFLGGANFQLLAALAVKIQGIQLQKRTKEHESQAEDKITITITWTRENPNTEKLPDNVSDPDPFFRRPTGLSSVFSKRIRIQVLGIGTVLCSQSVLWIRIQIGPVISNFVDLNP